MAELGIIEGFYGRPWTWDAKRAVAAFLQLRGYSFYIYAPKADEFLRKRWKEEHPADAAQELRALSAHCRQLGMRFGVGLSPYEIYRSFDTAAKDALDRKLAWLDAVGI